MVQMLPSLLVLLLHTAPAATVVALPEAELARRVDAIGFGAVVDTQVATKPGGGVRTRATIQIYRAVVGLTDGQTITIEVPGGDLPNGMRSMVAGAPRLVPGQLVFGFFEQRAGLYKPWGLSFGLLRARRDEGGDVRVFRDLDGLQLLSRKGTPMAAETVRLEDEPLEALIGRIRGHLGIPGISQPGGLNQ